MFMPLGLFGLAQTTSASSVRAFPWFVTRIRWPGKTGISNDMSPPFALIEIVRVSSLNEFMRGPCP